MGAPARGAASGGCTPGHAAHSTEDRLEEVRKALLAAKEVVEVFDVAVFDAGTPGRALAAGPRGVLAPIEAAAGTARLLPALVVLP